ncbi:MAG: NUDIX hydrolase [Shinella sp.]|nr:NUDIX hydrolase [Shinella sp.]
MGSEIEKDGHWHPEEGLILPLETVELAVSSEPHPFHLAARAEAAANWIMETAANPALYDGEMVLQREICFEGGTLRATGHLVPFSTFLWWRKTTPAGAGCHLFGLPLVVSSDGGVILIRMGAHTANAGRVYCAAGSLDRLDVRDGGCDIEGNMRREVREETGLDLGQAAAEPGYHLLRIGSIFTLIRVFRFDLPASELLRRIAVHMEDDPAPEIEEAFAVFESDAAISGLAPFMMPVLEWFFGREGMLYACRTG